MPQPSADLVVIGLGAMGAATAWRAARRGLTVVGIDARHPPHTMGSTHGDSRIIREAYFEHPQYVPLVQRAYVLWSELERTARTRLFQATGGLMIGTPDSTVVAGTLRAAAEHGLTVQTWTAAEIRARAPALRPAPDMVGVFEPRAGVLAPERAVAALLERAAADGATLRTDEPVLDWRQDAGGVRVRTTAGEYVSRRMIIAAGPWLPVLSGGLALPLAVERQVQYWFATPGAGCFGAGALPVFLIHTPQGRMLYGLPDQGGGLKLAEHHGGVTGPPDAVNREVSAEEQARFLAFASPWIDRLPAAPTRTSVRLYTNTPDGDFVLDRHPDARDVHIVSACSGHGFKFAPAVGDAVVSELLGEPTGVDLTPFRLSRFLV